LFIGIQFLMWTLGGLYFTWSDMDDIHGDHLVNENTTFWDTDEVLKGVENQLDSVFKFQVVEVLDSTYFQIRGLKDGKEAVVLMGLDNGEIRKPLNKEEAIRVAENTKTFEAEIKEVKFITETNNHHEYRGKPLPVWAITYGYKGDPTIYVSPELGQFVSIRHNNWRVFDWFWMLHTMDYSTRDEIGNTVLRGFSILGLVMIMSGFTLFLTSSQTVRKLLKKKT